MDDQPEVNHTVRAILQIEERRNATLSRDRMLSADCGHAWDADTYGELCPACRFEASTAASRAHLSVSIAHMLNAAPHNPETCAECQAGEHVTVDTPAVNWPDVASVWKERALAAESKLAAMKSRVAERDASALRAVRAK